MYCSSKNYSPCLFRRCPLQRMVLCMSKLVRTVKCLLCDMDDDRAEKVEGRRQGEELGVAWALLAV